MPTLEQSSEVNQGNNISLPPGLDNSREFFKKQLGEFADIKNKANVIINPSTDPKFKFTAEILVPEGKSSNYRYTYNGKDFQGKYSAVSKGEINFNTKDTLSATFPHTGLKLERGEVFTDVNGNTFYKLQVHIPKNYNGAIGIDALYGKAVIYSDADQTDIESDKIIKNDKPLKVEEKTNGEKVKTEVKEDNSYDRDPPRDKIGESSSIIEPNPLSDLAISFGREEALSPEKLKEDLKIEPSLEESPLKPDKKEIEVDATIEDSMLDEEIDSSKRKRPPIIPEDFIDEEPQFREYRPERLRPATPSYDLTKSESFDRSSIISNAKDVLASFGETIGAKILSIHEADLAKAKPDLKLECVVSSDISSLETSDFFGDLFLNAKKDENFEALIVNSTEGSQNYYMAINSNTFSMFSERVLRQEITKNMATQKDIHSAFLRPKEIDRYVSAYSNYNSTAKRAIKIRGQEIIRDKDGRLLVSGRKGQKLVIFDPSLVEEKSDLNELYVNEDNQPSRLIRSNSDSTRNSFSNSFNTVL